MAYKEQGNINPSEKFLILEYLSHTVFEGQFVFSNALKPEWYLRAADPRLCLSICGQARCGRLEKMLPLAPVFLS